MGTHCTASWDDGTCARPAKTAGFCHAHYERFRKGGNPHSPIRKRGEGAQPARQCSASGVHAGEPWDCERPTKAKGYCLAHWKQHKRVGQVRKLGTYAPLKTRTNAAGEYLCKSCDQYYPDDNFWAANGGLRPFCKPCDAAARRAMRYGISTAEADALLDAQGGCCAICGVASAESARAFAVDHDHACCSGRKTCGKCLRGILCHGCNLALGGFRDNVDLLRKAVAYLESHGAR